MTEPIITPDQQSLPPTTTAQEDMTIAGQRRINLIWEYTQAFIAIFVIVGYAVVVTWCTVYGKDIPASLSLLTGHIVGFYFSRTNHASIGGIGPKANMAQQYMGR